LTDGGGMEQWTKQVGRSGLPEVALGDLHQIRQRNQVMGKPGCLPEG
jgi:hypothetical protein